MAAEQQEQNRSEEPTPFKLKRARERGMVARSMELGFLGGLAALLTFITFAGHGFARQMAAGMRATLASGIRTDGSPDQTRALVGNLAWTMIKPIALLGGTILVIVILLEILQLRGLVFTAHPLKPDFSRLNPAKGVKRLFSLRMLKDTLKSLFKVVIYAIATWLLVRWCVGHYAPIIVDTLRMPEILEAVSTRLLVVFILIAFGFVVIDQVLVRREFLKQMRMSRREVTREAREREGGDCQ
jgi:flagellar biosynthetic protein FlhB